MEIIETHLGASRIGWATWTLCMEDCSQHLHTCFTAAPTAVQACRERLDGGSSSPWSPAAS